MTRRATLLYAMTGLLGGSLISGCLFASDDPEPKDISPLAVGNTWTYVDSVSSDGTVATSTAEVTITGTRTVSIHGESVTAYTSNTHSVGGPPSVFSAYVANIGHSNYNLGGEQDTARVLDRVLHLEYPTRAGRRYPTRFFSFRSEGGALVPVVDTIDIEVVDPRLRCAVPAGTFDCVQYRGYRKDGSLFATAYHAPGVGYLGYEIERTETQGDTVRTVRQVRRLTSYTLH